MQSSVFLAQLLVFSFTAEVVQSRRTLHQQNTSSSHTDLVTDTSSSREDQQIFGRGTDLCTGLNEAVYYHKVGEVTWQLKVLCEKDTEHAMRTAVAGARYSYRVFLTAPDEDPVLFDPVLFEPGLQSPVIEDFSNPGHFTILLERSDSSGEHALRSLDGTLDEDSLSWKLTDYPWKLTGDLAFSANRKEGEPGPEFHTWSAEPEKSPFTISTVYLETTIPRTYDRHEGWKKVYLPAGEAGYTGYQQVVVKGHAKIEKSIPFGWSLA